jgi:TPR repeat protein
LAVGKRYLLAYEYEKATEYFQLAHNLNSNGPTCYWLATAKRHRVLQMTTVSARELTYRQAIALFDEAAKCGVPEAKQKLGTLLLNFPSGTFKTRHTAEEYLQQSKEEGMRGALHSLVALYRMQSNNDKLVEALKELYDKEKDKNVLSELKMSMCAREFAQFKRERGLEDVDFYLRRCRCCL